MEVLKVLTPGAYTTVQDAGRFAFQQSAGTAADVGARCDASEALVDKLRLKPDIVREHVCEQIAAWGDVGMDQLAFGLPIEGMHHEEILATLELFGDKVIPEFDKDRKHSTDYYREQAVPKFGRFSNPCARAAGDVEEVAREM